MLLAILLSAAQVAAPQAADRCGIDDGVRWFEDSDYPEARARGERGVVVYRLQVDAEGCVTGCDIVEPSGIASIDTLTCPLLMRRARFSPALNAEGAPVPSIYTGARWWTNAPPLPPGFRGPEPSRPMAGWLTGDDYPGPALRAREQGNVGFRLEVDEIGRVTGCSIWLSSGSAALDAATCSLMTRRGRFNPARDADGKAMPGVFVHGIRWTLPPLESGPSPPG